MAMQYNGIAKALEECGELQQVLAKLLAYPDGNYPDGTDLYSRLEEEIGDVLATIEFLMDKHSNICPEVVQIRRQTKLERFQRWDKEA